MSKKREIKGRTNKDPELIISRLTASDNSKKWAKRELELMAQIWEHATDSIFLSDDKGNLVYLNETACLSSGYSREELMKMGVGRLVPQEQSSFIEQNIEQLKKKGGRIWEISYLRKDGSSMPAEMQSRILNVGDDELILTIVRDITERKQAEEELKKHRDNLEEMVQERTAELTRQSEIIQQQAQEILEISTPVLQVQEGVLVAPLIGVLDSQRTQRFMDQLLSRIVETNSTIALVDITGVPVIDTQTAQHIIDTISAVKLLGAQVILTGVKPNIAQTLVHLGIDLSGVITCSSLAAGLNLAVEELKQPVS